MNRSLLPGAVAATLALVVAGEPNAADMSKWAASHDAATGKRYIPVELWTGADWDGSRELKMGPADLSFGKRGEKGITGPLPWTRPGTGEVLKVYERNKEALQFHWVVDGGTAPGTDMHYIYSPGRGLVSLDLD